jgi:DNA-directed RNA polymerase subunit RPC12/RpoP
MAQPKCISCGGDMAAYSDKRGYPFAACQPCGAQFFVRNKVGKERFVARYGQPPVKGAKVAATPPASPASSAAPPSPATPTPKPKEPDRGSQDKSWW